eukprot:Sspe_Gene.31347::Locus_15475_Transcript_1_1_Confidence_1.000_Length_1816::g.31347::m.31347
MLQGLRFALATAWSSKAHRVDMCHLLVALAAVLGTFASAVRTESMMVLLSAVYLLHLTLRRAVVVACAVFEEIAYPKDSLPFAYSRLPAVLNYANGCILIFFCFSTLVEGLERLMHDHDASHSFTTLVLQCLLEATWVYRKNAQNKARALAEGTFVALLAMVSAVSVWLHGWEKIDIVFAFFTAVACTAIIWPAQKECTGVLILRTPTTLISAVGKASKQASTVKGVLEIADERFWMVNRNTPVGTMRVRYSATDDQSVQRILRAVHRCYATLAREITFQLEREASLPEGLDRVPLGVPSPRQLFGRPGFESAASNYAANGEDTTVHFFSSTPAAPLSPSPPTLPPHVCLPQAPNVLPPPPTIPSFQSPTVYQAPVLPEGTTSNVPTA